MCKIEEVAFRDSLLFFDDKDCIIVKNYKRIDYIMVEFGVIADIKSIVFDMRVKEDEGEGAI